MRGKKSIILILLFLILITNKKILISAFDSDTVSAVAAGMGNSFTAMDKVSAIFYNPATIGGVPSDSLFKSDFLYENKYNIDGYNYYALSFVVGKDIFHLIKLGFSGYYENVDNIINEKMIKITTGTTLLSFFKNIYIAGGVNFVLGTIDYEGWSEDENDPALDANTMFNIEPGLYAIYNEFRFGIVALDLLNDKYVNKHFPLRLGVVYDISKFSSLISMDIEFIKGINDYNRSWIKIGSLEIGKNYYPLIKIGFEKTIKNILSLRLGLRDFKIEAGAGIRFKGIELNYAIINNNIGFTHLIGVSIKRL